MKFQKNQKIKFLNEGDLLYIYYLPNDVKNYQAFRALYAHLLFQPIIEALSVSIFSLFIIKQ